MDCSSGVLAESDSFCASLALPAAFVPDGCLLWPVAARAYPGRAFGNPAVAVLGCNRAMLLSAGGRRGPSRREHRTPAHFDGHQGPRGVDEGAPECRGRGVGRTPVHGPARLLFQAQRDSPDRPARSLRRHVRGVQLHGFLHTTAGRHEGTNSGGGGRSGANPRDRTLHCVPGSAPNSLSRLLYASAGIALYETHIKPPPDANQTPPNMSGGRQAKIHIARNRKLEQARQQLQQRR